MYEKKVEKIKKDNRCFSCKRLILKNKKNIESIDNFCSDLCKEIYLQRKNFSYDSDASINSIIAMAWADDVPFDEINYQYGLTEGQVIKIMRKKLKISSFKLWRKRVTSRTTKHSQLMRS